MQINPQTISFGLVRHSVNYEIMIYQQRTYWFRM